MKLSFSTKKLGKRQPESLVDDLGYDHETQVLAGVLPKEMESFF
ncbi:hypothetical protein [Gimesia aquarii]|nr:hypothetical protein [Gimesia aquarii]